MRDITLNWDGSLSYSDSVDNVYNNIYISIMTPIGSYWYDLSFGSRMNEIHTITNENLQQIPQIISDSCAWLIQAGTIDTIEVSTEYDKTDLNGIKILLNVLKKNVETTYSIYYRVF